jgi:hypothetical protein
MKLRGGYSLRWHLVESTSMAKNVFTGRVLATAGRGNQERLQ